MVWIHPKQFSSGIVKKLHGPFKILRRINSNAYIVDHSSDFGVSSSANIEDLVACKCSILSLDKPLLNKPFPEFTFERHSLPPLSPKKTQPHNRTN